MVVIESIWLNPLSHRDSWRFKLHIEVDKQHADPHTIYIRIPMKIIGEFNLPPGFGDIRSNPVSEDGQDQDMIPAHHPEMRYGRKESFARLMSGMRRADQ